MAPIIPDPSLPRRTESGMATRAVNAAAGVLLAAMQQDHRTPTGLAIALDSACLLNSPETAAELNGLRTRVADLERQLAGKDRPVDEDPIRFALTDKAEQLPAAPRVRHLRELVDRQRAQVEADGLAHTKALALEDPHDSPLHHDYAISRDLPEVTR
ncbi:hypothetical protein [Streptomyces griseoluteus]|uniref:hypothetical protein n=1 Tax=Streptomyces griseoluteus TaxID=29306 RepID=UPI003807AB9A